MKRKLIYTLALVVFITMSCFAQQPIVKKNIKVNAEVNANSKAALAERTFSEGTNDLQESDETVSKEIIREVSAKVKEYIANGQTAEASAVIQSNMVKCMALNNSKLCEAGLNFHSGYLFQQVAKQDSVNKKNYQQRAINQYEKVLDVFPDNKAALNNLIRLNATEGNNDVSSKRVMAYIEQFPSETVHYFLLMGDLFLNEKKFEMACEFYRKAYQKDPRSERACNAMVSLYTKYNFSCALSGNVREFALDCKVIGLPNYSEELLRQEMTLAVKDQNFSKAVESMILWANVLTEYNWLFPEKVTEVINQMFPEGAVLSTSDNRIKNALTELEGISQAKTAMTMGAINFWDDFGPDASVSGDWERVKPMHVLLKTYYTKGEQAYFKNEYGIAEDFWEIALEGSQNFDKAFFTTVASDLAKLYHSRPEMDPGDKKLDALVVELFNMKGAAYQANDLRMIRQYHMTLGAIYYAKKKWDGGYATNAKFQLSRAVSDRFGPIVNPKFQKMLGDVYDNLGETEKAVETYGQSVQDYLSLDRIKEAEDLHAQTKASMSLNATQTKKYEALGTIIDWRKDLMSPNNAVLKGTTQLNPYLDAVSNAETIAEANLSKNFVQLQFFKGLSDLGSQFGDSRAQEQQIIYANALNRVKDGQDLSSEQDYYRVIAVINSLSKSLEQPKQFETMQMYTKGNLSYNTAESRKGYKVYEVANLNKEIKVPSQLFTLNDRLQDDYKKTNTAGLIQYKMNKGVLLTKDKK